MKINIRTVIVDDEEACIRKLSSDLMLYPEIEIVNTTTSSEKAKNVILKSQPQLLFLDIEMPRMNGLELLNEIEDNTLSNICIVFYSAFDRYMIDAIRISAFDFLLKPYKPEELKQIIERTKEKLKSGNPPLDRPIHRILADDRKFAVHTITGLLLLRKSEILCFRYQHEQRYWQLNLTDCSVHKLRLNITAKEILNINHCLIQISQDCILNIDHLASIENKTLRCILYPPFNNTEIYISRRYYSKIKDKLDIL